MRYFRFDINGPEVHVYPLVCLHIGAKQSNLQLIERTIKDIQNDPLAKWVYMGDAGECVTKTSKGNIYEQLMNPGDQLRVAADYLTPIKDKGLFGIRGNHGNRIDKDSGIGWDEFLCARIGIPYLGVSAFGNIVLHRNSSTYSFSAYVHHGASSSIATAGKVSAALKPYQFVTADLILTSHTHACGEVFTQHRAEADARAGKVVWKSTHAFACGSAYDSRSGYAEEKMYSPILPEWLKIIVKAKRVFKEGQESTIIDIDHKKLRGFFDLAEVV